MWSNASSPSSCLVEQLFEGGFESSWLHDTLLKHAARAGALAYRAIDRAGHVPRNTDSAGHLPRNTDNAGHPRRNTDSAGHLSRNTDRAGHVPRGGAHRASGSRCRGNTHGNAWGSKQSFEKMRSQAELGNEETRNEAFSAGVAGSGPIG
jgi:hypothetical protein